MIHIKDFSFVERERFAEVMKSVCVNGLLERLPQQILPRFRIGDVLEDGEYDVVADETLSGAEKAEVAHDNLALVSSEFVGLPQFDVALHRDLGGHPMIRTAVEIMFPSPFVFERNELVYVYSAAVEQSLVLGVDTLGEIMRSR